jgi:hypothetical protein
MERLSWSLGAKVLDGIPLEFLLPLRIHREDCPLMLTNISYLFTSRSDEIPPSIRITPSVKAKLN